MSVLLDVLLVLYALAVAVISLTGLRGLGLFRQLREGSPRSAPRVSIVIPVKNEADTLRDSLESVVALDYPEKEVIVVCAESTDGTEQIVQAFAGRVRVVKEPPRPEGWVGKCWACHQGFLNASGEVLLFTDGDVTHGGGSLSSSLARLEEDRIDLLSVWPRAVTRATSERMLFPAGSFFLAAGIAAAATAETPRGRVIKGANGQYILVTRKAYSAIGGHEAVKAEIIEDGAMGKLAVERGLHVVNMDGRGLLSYKPYASFREIWVAFERFSAGLLPGVRALLETVLVSLFFFTLPVVLLAAGLAFQSADASAAGLLVSLVSLGTMLEFYWRYSHARYVVLAPFAGLVMVAAFLAGFVSFRRLGIEWKGLLYRKGEAKSIG